MVGYQGCAGQCHLLGHDGSLFLILVVPGLDVIHATHDPRGRAAEGGYQVPVALTWPSRLGVFPPAFVGSMPAPPCSVSGSLPSHISASSSLTFRCLLRVLRSGVPVCSTMLQIATMLNNSLIVSR